MDTKPFPLYIFLFVLIFNLTSCRQKSMEIYVSPNGNDNSIGNASNPVASLQQAAKMVRLYSGKIPVTIYLSGGNYHLIQPLNLGVSDGGTAEAPIQWQAISGESPVINGGVNISNWKREKNGLWSARLPAEVQSDFRSFYVNDQRAIRARFPDNGFLKLYKAGQDNRTNFFFKKGDFPQINNINDLELVFIHDWSITRIDVKSIDWEINQLTAVDSIGARLPFFTLTNWSQHPRYYLENAIEYCDNPGEWYCDMEARKIYYYPYTNQRIDSIEAVVPIAIKLLTIKGKKEQDVGFVSFKGITFAYTDWQIPEAGYCGVQACFHDDRAKENKVWNTIPAAIELDLARNCGFYDCVIKHTGGSGIWIRQNCKENEIQRNHIYDISGNGVNLGEGKDRLVNGTVWWKSAPEQVSINNTISHSLIEKCGQQFYGAIGIWGGLIANTTIDHNEIRNLPYTGVSLGWMWSPIPTPCRENTINANHIHHIMNELSDGGGIYCLGLQPDSRITNNLIHDVTINAGRAESNGMFLDEGITDVLVENNIVYNIARSPLRFHKAFQNMVKNNVFVCRDSIPPIQYNRTLQADIKKIDNMVLYESSISDMEKLRTILKRRNND